MFVWINPALEGLKALHLSSILAHVHQPFLLRLKIADFPLLVRGPHLILPLIAQAVLLVFQIPTAFFLGSSIVGRLEGFPDDRNVSEIQNAQPEKNDKDGEDNFHGYSIE